jgi:hypothetical protein
MRLEELKLKHPELFGAPPTAMTPEMPQNIPQIILPPATNATLTNTAGTNAAKTNVLPFKLQSR